MKDIIEVKEKKDKEAFFNWADPFLISDQLLEEERMIRETAASFACLLYTSPSPRDATLSRMPSSA